MTRLSIIIISYNTKDLLKQTLDSLPVNPDWEIFVVDNNSQDGSAELIEHFYPQVKLMRNEANLGFAKANNQAIKEAKGEYLLLLNSDTQVKPNALEKMLAYLSAHSQVGMITPKVVLPNGMLDQACHRGEPTPWRAFTYFSKLEQVFPHSSIFGGYHQTHLDLTSIHPVEATAATALMVRRSAIDHVGMLDERFFFYAEDLDWCKRFREAGWKIVYFPDSEVLHHKSASGKGNKHDKLKAKQAKKHFWETMKLYYEKHYDKQYPWWVKRIIFLVIWIKKKI